MAGYDPNTARDRTGERYRNVVRPRDRRRQSFAEKVLGDCEAVACPECRSEGWRIIASREGALAVTQCASCGAMTRPFEMRVPQMSDDLARRMGLWVPPSVSVDIDIEND